MARLRKYKKAENVLVKKIATLFRNIRKKIVEAFSGAFQAGKKKLTIMIVPHSQKKVVSFQTSIFALIFVLVFLLGIFSAFFWSTHQTTLASRRVAELRNEAEAAQASLHAAREETAELIKIGKNFKARLSATLVALGLEGADAQAQGSSTVGDLAHLLAGSDSLGSIDSELSEVRQLATYLENSMQSVDEMGKLLESQTALFSDIPSLWPIKGGIGYISFPFGQNRHPITGQWYIHQGIDLSTRRSGDPIVATADGQVVTVEYDPSWGNYVILKHKHGFYTRYAHMQSYRVTRGQHVQQGQVIGYIGNTGISTAAHLHYEVHIGADVVDPIKYLNIKSTKK